MADQWPHIDLPSGLTGGSELWDFDSPAGDILNAEFFGPKAYIEAGVKLSAAVLDAWASIRANVTGDTDPRGEVNAAEILALEVAVDPSNGKTVELNATLADVTLAATVGKGRVLNLDLVLDGAFMSARITLIAQSLPMNAEAMYRTEEFRAMERDEEHRTMTRPAEGRTYDRPTEGRGMTR